MSGGIVRRPPAQSPLVPPNRGKREAGPEVWHCGCGERTTLDFEKDRNVVPVGWVTMKLWRGGADKYGGTLMEEKILCPHCAYLQGVGPQPPAGPMKMLPPKR